MIRAAVREICNFLKASEGAVASEYGLLIALIAMMIFGAVTAFGNAVSQNLYETSIALLPFGS